MSSKWQWNSIDLWVSNEDIAREIKRAELFVLNATESVFHFFGAGSSKYTLKGLVIGVANRASLETDAINNTARTLVTPFGNITNVRINSLKCTMKQYAGGTIGETSYDAAIDPVYEYEMELVTAP
jgi:hypothetical protein